MAVQDCIARRGPDSLEELHLCVADAQHFTAVSSVLHLRGAETVAQPLVSDAFVLQWNGEIFAYDGEDQHAPSEAVDFSLLSANDTQFLFSLLPKYKLAEILVRISGPWAFTLLSRREEVVYFGRDCFGRRSLLFCMGDTGLRIASVAPGREEIWQEAQSGVLYGYDIRARRLTTQQLPFPGITVNPKTSHELHMAFEESVAQFHRHLSAAVQRRVLVVPEAEAVGILFSGGIDSVVLAAMAAEIVATRAGTLRIDLINVAFENEGFKRSLKKGTDYFEQVPDRIAGRAAFRELQQLYPQVAFAFEAVDVSTAQYEEARARVVQLLHPSRTVMDLSIGIGLWFGAGQGGARGRRRRVLLVGMGADEQQGGYGRHRAAFGSGSWAALAAEMQLDVGRIGARNLGRDDRCISDHGREGRFPYLDEALVAFVARQPIDFKYDGQEDKRLIRQLARQCGFTEAVSGRPKKALQFGAKTAKMTGGDERGDDLL